MRIIRSLLAALLLATVALSITTLSLAQGDSPGLVLGMGRDFGYGGFGEVQGAMRLTIRGPADLQRVVFLMDDVVMGEATVAPWQLQFHTDSYVPGTHGMIAIGYTQGGLELRSNEIRTRFLSSDDAGRATSTLVISLLGGVGLLMLVAFGLTALLTRGRRTHVAPGTPRNYGLAGGAICPRCGRPYERHMFAPNMFLGKLERCPYCGRWAIVRARSAAELAAAEAAECKAAGSSASAPTADIQDQLTRDLDDSRFEDR